ncbi:MAG: S-adenosylmethionine decarboxylase [Proteobacteria bacterium]|nr:S-adenosylmethionine decarboxylase [Pseudomonadota bacterium]
MKDTAHQPQTVAEEESSSYGYELVLDLHGCNSAKFNRADIDGYFTELCQRISMRKCEVHFWDDVGVPIEERQISPQTKGTSAVCFILTSTVVVHTLDILEAVYVNIFSCKTFDPAVAAEFTEDWFQAGSCKSTFIPRV